MLPRPAAEPRASAGRDPWVLAILLAAAPLVLHSLGTPLGEPFADDFYFLHRELLGGPRTIWDGGEDEGGNLVVEGPPDAVAACEDSHMGRFLRAAAIDAVRCRS